VTGDYKPILPRLKEARVDRVNLEFAYPQTGDVVGMKRNYVMRYGDMADSMGIAYHGFRGPLRPQTLMPGLARKSSY
jgi:hypothetical protein